MPLPALDLFIAFTIASLTLLLLPGPAVMYITALGLREGRQPAIAAAVGLGIGNFTHVMAAALGISALLVSSALAFSIVKYAGAAYLIYMGIQTWRQPARPVEAATVSGTTSRREFRRGIVVNALNPKVAIFFLAFVPQFIIPGSGTAAGQVLILGVWFVLLGIATDAIYGISAGELGNWIRGRTGVQQLIQKLSGATFICLGVLAAVAGSERSAAIIGRSK